MNPTMTLQTQGLTVQFGALRALADISLTLTGPSTVGLIGPNGAGKSTLLNALSGFVPATTGSIHLDGEDITSGTPQHRVRQGLLRSFQTARMLEDESVLSNVLLGAESLPKPGSARQLLGTRSARRTERAAREQAFDLLDRLELTALADLPASALSTASRRLVELARVLMAKPRMLLLDEPAAGLDAKSRVQLSDTILDVHAAHPCLIVLVEHDVSIVRRVCERTVVLVSGEVMADGDTETVLKQPDVRSAYFGGIHAHH